MLNSRRFPFLEKYNELGEVKLVPDLPLTLTYRDKSIRELGLLDTGASVNVLPYEIGLQLGAVWEEQTTSVILTGFELIYFADLLKQDSANLFLIPVELC